MIASHRIRIGHAVVASLAFLAIAFGNVASVRADGEVSSFESGGTADYSYTGGGSTGPSTLTTTTSPLTGIALLGSSFFSPTGPFGADLTLSPPQVPRHLPMDLRAVRKPVSAEPTRSIILPVRVHRLPVRTSRLRSRI